MAEKENPLRTIFDQVAWQYDQVRPGYPEAMFEEMIALSGIPPGGRILEIGCGTGQATLPLARRGYPVQCIELGEHLAQIARYHLADYPQVQVIVGAFEEVPLETGAFDLAISGTAFHWIDPTIAYPKIASALKPAGAIALFWNLHVYNEAGKAFFETVQEVYKRELPELVRDNALPPYINRVPEPVKEEIEQTGLFGAVTVRRYPWEVVYDADRYIHLLDTYSDHHHLDREIRDRLYRGIASLIDTRFGGHITKGYLTILYIARRK